MAAGPRQELSRSAAPPVRGVAASPARIGDGFFPAKGGLEELPALFDSLRDECTKVGRKPSEVELTTGLDTQDLDTVRRYEDIGVSRLVIPPPAFEPDGLRKGLEEFANKLINAA